MTSNTIPLRIFFLWTVPGKQREIQIKPLNFSGSFKKMEYGKQDSFKKNEDSLSLTQVYMVIGLGS